MHVITYYVKVYYMRIWGRIEWWKKKKRTAEIKHTLLHGCMSCRIPYVQQEVYNEWVNEVEKKEKWIAEIKHSLLHVLMSYIWQA